MVPIVSLVLFCVALVLMLFNLYQYLKSDTFEDKVLSLIWVTILTVTMYGVQP